MDSLVKKIIQFVIHTDFSILQEIAIISSAYYIQSSLVYLAPLLKHTTQLSVTTGNCCSEEDSIHDTAHTACAQSTEWLKMTMASMQTCYNFVTLLLYVHVAVLTIEYASFT